MPEGSPALRQSGFCKALKTHLTWRSDPGSSAPQRNDSLAARAAASIAGKANVIRELPPTMGAEEFAWMLQERPRCYVRVGNGTEGHGSCVVHNPRCDFNDDALPYDANFWAALVEQELSLEDLG